MFFNRVIFSSYTVCVFIQRYAAYTSSISFGSAGLCSPFTWSKICAYPFTHLDFVARYELVEVCSSVACFALVNIVPAGTINVPPNLPYLFVCPVVAKIYNYILQPICFCVCCRIVWSFVCNFLFCRAGNFAQSWINYIKFLCDVLRIDVVQEHLIDFFDVWPIHLLSNWQPCIFVGSCGNFSNQAFVVAHYIVFVCARLTILCWCIERQTQENLAIVDLKVFQTKVA